MRNYLIVTTVVVLGFVARAVPDFQVSAHQDDAAIAKRCAPRPGSAGRVNHCFHQHARQPYGGSPIVGGEIYFMDYLTDRTFALPRRITRNDASDIFPSLSPDGRERSCSTAIEAALPGSRSTPRTCFS